ncbi:MAG: exodeoxyribonuclease VII small subunit [Lactobacillus sp.]|jgi:exodeoxyribonuclease VII small subunit|nr:exodeoxyribonuclease VII small subunit [Lactobacillus sp.]MCH3906104.1 exodeoxyribonuclease VII small subunit [Lactobacillus sp.]MCH3990318.1 exodeoxyribonuclease VII small subunit [Lactobacillus sp.]MCH4068967.1 exodeoxyribonuclease VII small subunit [Lactobacillus sp.]MCI1303369.1 exodeoxyribonuclease VII small subunit [Lactobacillus sp.]
MANKKNNFEAELKELEDIVTKLEDGNVPLADALDQFKAGVALARNLEKELTAAQETVAKLVNPDGSTQQMDPQNAGTPDDND